MGRGGCGRAPSRPKSTQPFAREGRFSNRWDRGGVSPSPNPPARPWRGQRGDTASSEASPCSRLFSLEREPRCWCHVTKLRVRRGEEVANSLPQSFSVPHGSKSSRRQGGQDWHLPKFPGLLSQSLLGRPSWSPSSPLPRSWGAGCFSPAAGCRLGGGGLLTCSASGKRELPGWASPWSALEKASAKQALRRSCLRNHLRVNRSIRYP